jgi:hypothetical protein
MLTFWANNSFAIQTITAHGGAAALLGAVAIHVVLCFKRPLHIAKGLCSVPFEDVVSWTTVFVAGIARGGAGEGRATLCLAIFVVLARRSFRAFDKVVTVTALGRRGVEPKVMACDGHAACVVAIFSIAAFCFRDVNARFFDKSIRAPALVTFLAGIALRSAREWSAAS